MQKMNKRQVKKGISHGQKIRDSTFLPMDFPGVF